MERFTQKISANPKQAFLTGVALIAGLCLLSISSVSFVFEALRYTAVWLCLGYSVWNLLSLQTKREHHPRVFAACVAVTSLIPWLVMCFVVFVLFAPTTLEPLAVSQMLHFSVQAVLYVSVGAVLVFLALSAVKSKYYFSSCFTVAGLWAFANSFTAASAFLAEKPNEWLLYFAVWLLPCVCGFAANLFFFRKKYF